MINNKTQPKNWQKVKLQDISLLISRGAQPEYVASGGVRVINQKCIRGGKIDFNESRLTDIRKKPIAENKYLKEYDILVNSTGTGTVGRVSQIKKLDEPLVIDSHVTLVRPDLKTVWGKFLGYKLSCYEKFLEGAADGSTSQVELSREIIRNLEIILPPLSSQESIADILSAFDDKIGLNNKINQNLEQIAQAIFKEWFVKNKKKDNNGKLGDLMDIVSGFPFSSKIYNSKKGLGVVTIKNVQDGNFVRDFDSFIENENLSKRINQNCILEDGDVLLSLTGNVGRVCIVYGGKYLLNQRVAKIKPKSEKDLAFCYFLFRQTAMQNLLINMAKGSAQPNLSPVETGKIEFAVPSRDLLDDFSKAVTPIYQKIVGNINENQKLASLRDLLLPKLMSGEIRV